MVSKEFVQPTWTKNALFREAGGKRAADPEDPGSPTYSGKVGLRAGATTVSNTVAAV
jgi:hypothetical protein